MGIFFGGAGSFVVFLVVSLVGILGGIQRAETQGRRGFALEPGEYTVYWGNYLVQVAAATGKMLPAGGIAIDRLMGLLPIL